MLKNEEILEQFKKSLTATTKSISQNNLVEINFTKENSSIEGNLINLPEPNIESLKKNLTYIRAEADALALEFRFHSKEIHNSFIDDNDMANEIFNAVEQSRVEAKGSISFKGIKSNITKKHSLDLKKKSQGDENNISEYANLMVGRNFFLKFIDKFIDENQKIWKELVLNYQAKDFVQLKRNLHKLSGVGATIVAIWYHDVLHLAYKNIDSENEISDEEFTVLLNSSKGVEKEMNEIKLKWQQSDS